MSYQMQGLPFTLITQACMYICASNWRLHLQSGAAGGRAKRAPLLVIIMEILLQCHVDNDIIDHESVISLRAQYYYHNFSKIMNG